MFVLTVLMQQFKMAAAFILVFETGSVFMRKVFSLSWCCCLFLAASFFLISAGDAYARSDYCPRHQVKTDLQAKRHKTRFQHGSLNDINGYLNSHSVLAFVGNPLSIEPFFKFSLQDVGNRRVCVMLDAVKVNYIASPRIVMPSNFRKNSCEYKIILTHEKRHLKVHYDYHERSVPQYKAFLGRTARSVPVGPPVKTQEEIEAVKQHISRYFVDEFYTLVGKSIGEMRRQQEKIDSQQEYTFTGRKIDRCAEEERNKKNGTKKSIKVYDDFRK